MVPSLGKEGPNIKGVITTAQHAPQLLLDGELLIMQVLYVLLQRTHFLLDQVVLLLVLPHYLTHLLLLTPFPLCHGLQLLQLLSECHLHLTNLLLALRYGLPQA